MRDGSVWTSAGVTAGMDLALALVEEDLDRDAALTIARHLVLFLRRPGNQSQFSATLAAQQPEREPLREVQRLVSSDVAGRPLRRGDGRARPHEPAPLRARLPRRDRRHAGPLRRARAPGGGPPALEETAASRSPPLRGACGFGTAETMRRVFLRALARRARRVPPALPRRRPPRAAGLSARAPAAAPIARVHPATDSKETTMNIAIVLYDRFTALDAIGPYEVLSRLPGGE